MAIGTDEHRTEAPLRLALRIVALVRKLAMIFEDVRGDSCQFRSFSGNDNAGDRAAKKDAIDIFFFSFTDIWSSGDRFDTGAPH